MVVIAGSERARLQSPAEAWTALPIVFSRTVNASRAHAGDAIAAATMQEAVLRDGTVLPKSTKVSGRLVAVRPFRFNPAPYAKQQPSVLALRFEQVAAPTLTIDVVAGVRALAGWSDSRDAMRAHALDEHDIVGTVSLIGGSSYRADQQNVIDLGGAIVGYSRRNGVFGRLLAATYASRDEHIECPGSGDVEQSIGIFSPGACGVYGMPDIYLGDNGLGAKAGTFSLESWRRTVTVDAQSTALVQIRVGILESETSR